VWLFGRILRSGAVPCGNERAEKVARFASRSLAMDFIKDETDRRAAVLYFGLRQVTGRLLPARMCRSSPVKNGAF
jgi:hypothetical protein